MRRKLVQQGKHCLMSAIPKKWLDQHGLVKGDYINFEEIEDKLLLSAKPFMEEKEISIDIKMGDRVWIIRLLQMLYDSGFKKIGINFSSQTTIPHILEAVSYLKSYRVINIENSKCFIESADSEIDFDNYFRRLFLNIKELPVLFSNFLIGEKGSLVELKGALKIVFDGCMELKRNINTSQLPLEFKYYYTTILQFEEIADHYFFLLKYLEKKKKHPQILLELNNKLVGLMKDVHTNFYNFDLDWFVNSKGGLIWKWFETEEEPLLVYHLRAVSEKIKNIAKYRVGIGSLGN